MKSFYTSKQLVIPRKDLKKENIDIEDKTIIIGFNEPKFKKSKKDLQEGDIDSKLNARFITYFLPAVEIARMQKKRPRFCIVSGLNMALKWNADTEEQKKIMMANNAIKFDFLKTFFETFYVDDFSLIEYIIPQDVLKVPESRFLEFWNLIEKKHPEELEEIRFQFTKFLFPKEFNVKTYADLNEEQKEKLKTVDASVAFKYAIGHLFVLGDVNFEGNYIHNPNGYISVGGEAEIFFNVVRDLAYKILKDSGELFDKQIIVYDNYKIILENEHKVPPPYNGMFEKKDLLEVTYENEKSLDFYDTQEKLKSQMDYMYENLISRKEYENFWNDYRKKYFDLKARYKEAYNIQTI